MNAPQFTALTKYANYKHVKHTDGAKKNISIIMKTKWIELIIILIIIENLIWSNTATKTTAKNLLANTMITTV